MNATISMREYLEKGKTFLIPNYQRGYVWGQKKKGSSKGSKDSVNYMLDSLINGYAVNSDIFIQGVTVSESKDNITVIDGQQRTTFFFLLLKYLGYDGKFTIQYMIRSQSDEYLSSPDILKDFSENRDECFQDIYFFKNTLRIIHKRINEPNVIDREEFMRYILDHVKFLYIDIPEHKAKTVFTMMNGNKAEMKTEELIKAELLRIASLNSDDFDHKDLVAQNAIEWDNNLLRSRYAREWDKWLQWWNREKVQHLYKTTGVMGLLIISFLRINNVETSFEAFKKEFLSHNRPVEAKRIFDRLRRLQKRFEDAYKDAITYNKIGAILRVCDNRESFIKWYFGESEVPSPKLLDKYYRWTFLGISHSQILDNDVAAFEEKYNEAYSVLSSNNLYNENPEAAFRLLLRLNIDEDCNQEEGKGRKFDFSIWDKVNRGRSLEHIYPKSKVWHHSTEGEKPVYRTGDGNIVDESVIDNPEYISRESCRYTDEHNLTVVASEHSIGNLVLLYKDDNSTFSNSSYDEKKQIFFNAPVLHGNKKPREIFKSRHLLHSIYKFALSTWGGADIARNKKQTLMDFKTYYGK